MIKNKKTIGLLIISSIVWGSLSIPYMVLSSRSKSVVAREIPQNEFENIQYNPDMGRYVYRHAWFPPIEGLIITLVALSAVYGVSLAFSKTKEVE